MLGNMRGAEWLILLLLVVLLFGARRLPDAARGLGRSLRIFKAETKGLTDSDDAPAVDSAQAQETPVTEPTAENAPADPGKPTAS